MTTQYHTDPEARISHRIICRQKISGSMLEDRIKPVILMLEPETEIREDIDGLYYSIELRFTEEIANAYDGWGSRIEMSTIVDVLNALSMNAELIEVAADSTINAIKEMN